METLQLECRYAQEDKFEDKYVWVGNVEVKERKTLEGKRTVRINGTSVDAIDGDEETHRRYIRGTRDLNDGELEFIVFPWNYQPIFYTFKLDEELGLFIGWYEWVNPEDSTTKFGGYATLKATKIKLTGKELEKFNTRGFLFMQYGLNYQFKYGNAARILLSDDFARFHRSPESCSFEAAKAYFKEHMEPIRKLGTCEQQQNLH